MGFVLPLVISLIAVLAISGIYFYNFYQRNCVGCNDNGGYLRETATTTTILVGNDRDSYGCIGSVGYSWCSLKNKCLRSWEEKCESTNLSTSSTSSEKATTTTTTNLSSCTTNENCREIVCRAGGFAHELCIQGKCTISPEVKNRCMGATPTR